MNKFLDIFGKAKNVVFRYPMVLLMVLILAVSWITLVDLRRQENAYNIVRLAVTSALGISLFFAIKMLSQRMGKLLILQLLGIGILVIFYFLLPDNETNFSELELFWIVPSFILSHLLVAFVAFFQSKNEINFWEYNKNLFIHFILTILFSGVLIGGIELAILAVDKLFNLDIDDDIYFKTFLFLSSFGSCFIFLTFNEEGLSFLEKKGKYPIVLKFFTQFILIPLLLIYLIILYLYSTKILIKWELPRGWVSYLILAYSIVGILALLLVHPLKNETAKSWVKIFSKAFYYTLIPLLILLYVAIFTRILEYGYTEARYFVLLIAIWLTSIVLYSVIFKKASIKFIPISLFCFGLFALIMPYFNTFSVAKRSQKNALMEIFNGNQLIKNGKINFDQEISGEIRKEIRDKIEFLHKRENINFIFNYTDNQLKNELLKINYDYQFSSNFVENFTNIKYNDAIEMHTNKRIYLNSDTKNYHIKNYDYLFVIDDNFYGEQKFKIKEDTFGFTFKEGYYSHTFEMTLNEKTTVNLEPKIKALFASYSFDDENKSIPEISIATDIKNYHLKIYFDQLSYYESNKNYYYVYNKAIILIKEK